MVRREMLGVMGAGAGLVALGGGLTLGQQEKGEGRAGAGHETHGHDGGEHGQHLETLGRCAKLCEMTVGHCLGELRKGGEDREAHARALEAASGCAEFCSLTACLMASHNMMARHIHEACANACRDCAAACDAGGGQDQGVMKQCADACRECEKMCREMAQHDHGAHEHGHEAGAAKGRPDATRKKEQ